MVFGIKRAYVTDIIQSILCSVLKLYVYDYSLFTCIYICSLCDCVRLRSDIVVVHVNPRGLSDVCALGERYTFVSALKLGS